jgi:hypothetical protein
MSPNLAINCRPSFYEFSLFLTPLIVLDDHPFRDFQKACYLSERIQKPSVLMSSTEMLTCSRKQDEL